jgi:acetyltransferase-like isoleucine patch superfamily enzyme
LKLNFVKPTIAKQTRKYMDLNKTNNVRAKSIIDLFDFLKLFYLRSKGRIIYKFSFKYFGDKSIIIRPVLIKNSKYISIGHRVIIRDGARLEVVGNHSGRCPILAIGDNVNIEQNVHIVCHSRIEIGSNVSITPNCSIVDVTHPYSDIKNSNKIGDRILEEESYVEIGEGSFIGIGSTILPNVRIGRQCVIGANSLVTRSIPDYSVAAGSPAQVIKKFNQEINQWESIKICKSS